MKGAYIVAEGDLTLREITPETAAAADLAIIRASTGPADLWMLQDMIRPAPHRVEADPSVRRAAPRHGISA